jgi:flagellar biogenesis protein FliO
MPSTRLRPLTIAGAWAALSLAAAASPADHQPPTAPLGSPPVESRLVVPKRPASSGPAAGSGGWWLGTAGIAGALAIFGGASLASKRFLPARDSGPIRVVGRTALSPRHSVYLLRVGDRVLILGTGPQGAPANLGEVTDPAELARLAPRRAVAGGTPAARTTPAFDQRIGDDE